MPAKKNTELALQDKTGGADRKKPPGTPRLRELRRNLGSFLPYKDYMTRCKLTRGQANYNSNGIQ